MTWRLTTKEGVVMRWRQHVETEFQPDCKLHGCVILAIAIGDKLAGGGGKQSIGYLSRRWAISRLTYN